MPTRLRLAIAAMCALVLVVATSVRASAAFGDDIVALINQSRVQEGQTALIQNTDMNAVAQAWAQYLVENSKFEHNPDYTAQIPAAWSNAAENLAGNTNPAAERMHQQLMESPDHYANIMGDFTHIGVGFAAAEDGAMSVLVELFATYSSPLPGDIEAEPPEPSDAVENTSDPSSDVSTTDPITNPSAENANAPDSSQNGDVVPDDADTSALGTFDRTVPTSALAAILAICVVVFIGLLLIRRRLRARS